VKNIGDPHGENHLPSAGQDSGASRAPDAERFVIVDLPEDFDIDQTFRSEQDTADQQQSDSTERSDRVLPEAIPPAPGPHSPADREPQSPSRGGPRSLSIADLLDNHVRLEWHEAVAIAQHLCGVMVRDPAANVHHSLVEPWNVEITNVGDIQVLPGGSSSDPLVKQVGRVLGALIQDALAPAELRLVAAQACFEVPVYASVDDLAAALRRFERPGDLDAIRAAYQRGLEAKFSVSQPPRAVVTQAAAETPAASLNLTPKGTPPPLAAPRRPRSEGVSPRTLAAVAVAIALVAASMLAMRLWTVLPDGPFVPATSEPQVRQFEARPSAPPERPETVPAPPVQPVTLSAHEAAHRQTPPPVSPRADRAPAARAAVGTAVSAAPPSRAAAAPRRSAPANELLEAERRATGLLASGQAEDASILFDAIVMKNPFYQLDPSRSNPEALAAFEASKRVLVPVLVRRQYQEARAAFNAGEFSKAIAAGGRALTLLNSIATDAEPGDLNGELTNLVARATAARVAEEETVYSEDDSAVTPPRPIGRQLSTASQPHDSTVPPTGRLEILVDRSGRVESVRLATPHNGYHDRMIVSAVKAWRYRPAQRNGKPVRYFLVMSISLPDL